MELARRSANDPPGSLSVTAISAVFTIGHVARLLGEDDEDCLYELSISMFPEDGCLHVYGVAEVAATAFTPCGIEHPNRVPRRDRLPQAGFGCYSFPNR